MQRDRIRTYADGELLIVSVARRELQRNFHSSRRYGWMPHISKNAPRNYTGASPGVEYGGGSEDVNRGGVRGRWAALDAFVDGLGGSGGPRAAPIPRKLMATRGLSVGSSAFLP